MIDKFLSPFTLLAGPCLVFYLCIKSLRDNKQGVYNLPSWNIVLSWTAWLTVTPAAKLGPRTSFTSPPGSLSVTFSP